MTNSDDTDMVVIARGTTKTSIYHTTECSNYPSKPREITQEEAERRRLRECQVCQGNINVHKRTEPSLAQKLNQDK